jgi:hypothetical protein
MYIKQYLPVIQWDSDDDIFEIDEMYLGAKQRGKHGRRPATNHLVFGIQFISWTSQKCRLLNNLTFEGQKMKIS